MMYNNAEKIKTKTHTKIRYKNYQYCYTDKDMKSWSLEIGTKGHGM